MGFLIDTNVLSEIRKGQRANAGVRLWFGEANESDLFVSVLTLGEIRRGIESIRRRDPASAKNLDGWFGTVQASSIGRVLLVTPAVADRWGRLIFPTPCRSLMAFLPQQHSNMG